MSDNEYTGTFPLQISPKIIQHISSSMYRSPSSAIKELLINSFDADATNVELGFSFALGESFEPRINRLNVRDNGEGMDGDTLQRVFTQIGDSIKSKFGADPNADMFTKKLHRPLVGRLGIGILAIASATSEFKVISKMAGSNEEFTAEIFINQFDKTLEKVAAMEDFPMGRVMISKKKVTNTEESYTNVEITSFKPPFMTLIDHEVEESFVFNNICPMSAIGNPESEEDYFRKYLHEFYDNDRISNLKELDKTIIQIGNIVPVKYLSDGPVRKQIEFNGQNYEILNSNGEVINEIKERLRKYNFNVTITVNFEPKKVNNKFVLFKPQRFPTDNELEEWKEKGRTIEQLKPNIFEFSHTNDIGANGSNHIIEIKGYAYHQNSRLNPREYRGLLYRVYGVTIGEEYRDDLRIYSNNPIALHQTSVEIYLDKGFQSVVNIDRESFYEGGDAFQYLKAYLEHTLSGGAKFLEDVNRDTTTIIKFINTNEVTYTVPKHPQIYDKISEAFREGNKNPILSRIKSDMKAGLTAKRSNDDKKRPPDSLSQYIKSKKIANSVELVRSTFKDRAILTIENGHAVYSLPVFSYLHKDAVDQLVMFVLLTNLKDGKSTLDKEYLDLLIRIIEDFL
jgi:hypothetical protein